MAKKKMIFVMGVTARKQSESEYFLQICKYWINYVCHIKTIEFLVGHYIKKLSCFHETAVILEQNERDENNLDQGGNC